MRRPPPSSRPARAVAAALAWAALALLVPEAPASAANLVEGIGLSAGTFNVLNSDSSAEAGFELRVRPFYEGTGERGWILRPAVGGMATTDGGIYGYAGFRLELPLGERWLLVPQTAAGLYDRGDAKELGGSIQFRSGLELSYRLTEAHSLGAVFYHLSNAGLEEPNPGSESLALVWSWR